MHLASVAEVSVVKRVIQYVEIEARARGLDGLASKPTENILR